MERFADLNPAITIADSAEAMARANREANGPPNTDYVREVLTTWKAPWPEMVWHFEAGKGDYRDGYRDEDRFANVAAYWLGWTEAKAEDEEGRWSEKADS